MTPMCVRTHALQFGPGLSRIFFVEGLRTIDADEASTASAVVAKNRILI